MDLQLGMRRGAFTLVELLVVIALIALLAAGLGLVFTRGDAGVRLRSSEVSAANVFQAARAEAILRQTRTRVLVQHADSDFPERNLRYLGVVYQDTDDPTRWVAANDGSLLAEGVYYWAAKAHHGIQSMRLEFPRYEAVGEGAGSDWYYYEFDAAGRSPGLHRFVIGALHFEPGAHTAPPFTEQTPIGGFALFPLGGIGFPEHPEDLR